jgi:uncharacterized protein YjbI with pentapeptide repeats
MFEKTNINQKAKDIEYLATSGTGSATVIVIHNYHSSRESSVTPVDPAMVPSDEILLCPYRGLYHFDIEDAEFYFGREVFVEELFQTTQNRNFIPVLGASGSGKSSVVLAGLVPKLQQEGHWQFTYFRPGADPFYNLASALVPLYRPESDATDQVAQARKLADYFCGDTVSLSDIFVRIQQNHPNDRVLLIADQFEEIYTLCPDESIRRRFLDLLVDSINSPLFQSPSPMVLVSTMRADFLGDALSYRPFADLLGNDVKIGSMNRKELTAVIEKPPAKLGVTFEDGLVDRILDDVKDEPGNLPLLESALTSLWEGRAGKQLNHAAYQAIGKVQGALTSHADKQYGQLSLVEQEQIRQIFIQLVNVGEGLEDTRRVATKAELGEASWSLVKKLADARLVVTSRDTVGQETVEVVHEALIRKWSKLRQWVDEKRQYLLEQRKIERQAKEWQTKSKQKDYLLQGKPLVNAEKFLKEQTKELPLSPLSIEFIDKSCKRRRNGRQRLVVFGLAFGLLVPTILGMLLVKQLNIVQFRQQIEEDQGKTNSNRRIQALQQLVKWGESLNSIKLVNADLSGAYLSNADLGKADLRRANLFNADLSGAWLAGSDLSGADLRGTNLIYANLFFAKLVGANLNHAFLRGTNLKSAFLLDADFRKADLRDTNLEEANLNRANLSSEQLIHAKLCKTTLPNGKVSNRDCKKLKVEEKQDKLKSNS